MTQIKFKPLPKELPEVILAHKVLINRIEKLLPDFAKRHFNGPREKAVIYCLSHAIDLGKGCLLTVNEELPDSLTTLLRAILDTLFWARYVTLSNENAQEFADSTLNELKRISRKNIHAGYLKVYDTRTNADKTTDFINRKTLNDINRRVSIETIAKLGGLEPVYTVLYGHISMVAHGRAYDLRDNTKIKDDLYVNLCATVGILQCIEAITSDWITFRKQTSLEMISEILGI
jgi:hypothetical protein